MIAGLSRRLPFFYGWIIVAVAFVTMALGVNARTAFSLLFPPILTEFGWQRGVTAGAFSFGFLISAMLSPLLGRSDGPPGTAGGDGAGYFRHGGRADAGDTGEPALACLRDARGSRGRRQCLPRLHRRGAVCCQRGSSAGAGSAMSIAFSGVGIGSMIMMPLLQAIIERSGWRAACWADGSAGARGCWRR